MKDTKELRKIQRKRRKRKIQLIRRGIVGVCVLTAAIFFIKTQDRNIPVMSNLEDQSYPPSMVEFMEKYPQAEQFVLDYPKKKDLDLPIDLSEEIQKGEIPLFMQWDERWGYKIYGDDFLGVNGCGPTTLSMVQCGLTGESIWNPYEVACMAVEQGYYVSGVGSSWDLMTEGARRMGLTVHEVGYGSDLILEALRSGLVIICSMGPGDFTYTGHFVALTGLDEKEHVIVRDCNSKDNSERRWTIDELLPQIRGLWGYSV